MDNYKRYESRFGFSVSETVYKKKPTAEPGYSIEKKKVRDPDNPGSYIMGWVKRKYFISSGN